VVEGKVVVTIKVAQRFGGPIKKGAGRACGDRVMGIDKGAAQKR
jgi:hypothetical protein